MEVFPLAKDCNIYQFKSRGGPGGDHGWRAIVDCRSTNINEEVDAKFSAWIGPNQLHGSVAKASKPPSYWNIGTRTRSFAS